MLGQREDYLPGRPQCKEMKCRLRPLFCKIKGFPFHINISILITEMEAPPLLLGCVEVPGLLFRARIKAHSPGSVESAPSRAMNGSRIYKRPWHS